MGFVFFRNRRQFVTEKKTIKFLKDPRSKLAFDKYFFLKCQVRRPKRGDGGNRKTTNCASPPTPPRKKSKAVNSSGQGRQEDLDQPLSSVRWNPCQKANQERHRVALGWHSYARAPFSAVQPEVSIWGLHGCAQQGWTAGNGEPAEDLFAAGVFPDRFWTYPGCSRRSQQHQGQSAGPHRARPERAQQSGSQGRFKRTLGQHQSLIIFFKKNLFFYIFLFLLF